MKTIVGRVNDEKVEINGINAVLTLWAFNSKIGKTLFLKNQNVKNAFLKALSNIGHDESYIDSKFLIEEIWGHYPCIGPLPLISELSSQQFDRVHHPDYRDHISHTFKVFLLGLFIYDSCEVVKEEIHKEITINSNEKVNNPEKDFIKLWTICSLSHDIGYVLESEITDPGLNSELYSNVANSINKTLDNPIASTYYFKKINFSKEFESSIVDDLAIPISRIKSYLRIGIFRDKDLLIELDKYAEIANLGKKGERPIFRRYYEFAHQHKPTEIDRNSFLDHGITSSLILMHVWNSYKERILHILKEKHSENLSTPFLKELHEVNNEIKRTQSLIMSAAGAIALHNINLRIWNKDDLMAWHLYRNLFKIKLFSDSTKKENLPIAFLLILSDTLQEWDRFKFREPKKEDIEKQLLSKDFIIEIKNGKLLLYYIKDYVGPNAVKMPNTNEHSKFFKMKNALINLLQKETIEKLIDCGLYENLASEEIDLEKVYFYEDKAENKRKIEEPINNSIFVEDNNILNYINIQISKYKIVEKTYVELSCLSKIEESEFLRELYKQYDASFNDILKDFFAKR